MSQLPVDPLTPAEWSVMKAVWELDGEAGAREIHQHLLPVHGWAITTVKTLLTKIVDKGFLVTEEDGRRFIYRAAQSEMDLLRRAADALLAKSAGETRGGLLCYLAGKVDLSDQEAAELRKILDRNKRSGGRKS